MSPRPDAGPDTGAAAHSLGSELPADILHPAEITPVRDALEWCFSREIEHAIPHKLTLPPLDEDAEAVGLGLALIADRVTADGPNALRLERAGRPGIVRLDLTTMRWRATPCGTEGRGLLELAMWMRRRTLLGTACMLKLALMVLCWGRR